MLISRKLPIAAAVLTIVSVGLASIASLSVSSHYLEEKSIAQLQAVADGKRNQLNAYFNSIKSDLDTIAKTEGTISAFGGFVYRFGGVSGDATTELQNRYINQNPNPLGQKDLLDTADVDGYDKAHKLYHPTFRQFIKDRGYYDLFFVDLKGNIIYSVFKEADYATNLETGAWKASDLAKVWKQTIAAADPNLQFSTDYNPYGPSSDAPAAFIGQSVFQGEELIGSLILQMPNDKIGEIANSTTGLGETGETVLLKSDGTMITDSTKTAEVEALTVKLALDPAVLAGAQNQNQYGFIEEFRGEKYGAALTGLTFGEQNWVVGAMISDREALMGVTMLRYIVLAIAAGLVAIALGAAFLFSRSITKPIEAVIGDMNELVSGNTRLELAGAERNDEIGKMFKAVSVFRDAAIEKDRLEEESEETRTLTEQERRQNEIAKAEDAEKINHVIDSLAGALKELSVGNLTVQIKSPFEGDLDRVRVDFNNSVAQLSDTLSQINSVSVTLKDNSREIANTTVELSQRTETQAASLEETSAALDEITATVRETSERATEAAQKAKDAHTDTEQSGQVVAKAVSAMEGIEKASGDINNIINVIDEIAFQTNLLALNAGVEAARAGEAGKGFAVVAQEVRELAQRSASAAKEIKDLINKSASEVSNGVSLVQQTGDALSKISEHVAEINTRIETISTGAQEQLTGIQEVNAAVNSMDQVTQQNAAMVEENTAVTQEMSEQVASLASLISTFKVEGASAQTSSSQKIVQPANQVTQKVSQVKNESPKTSERNKPKPVYATNGNSAVASDLDTNWDEF